MGLQGYVNEIRQCLHELNDDKNVVRENRLHQLTFEAMRLSGRNLQLKAVAAKAANVMSDLRPGSKPPSFFANLLVSRQLIL